MAEQVTIDKAVFHNRLAAFLAAWKTDKRSGDSLFGGADSIVLLVGKASDAGDSQKTNAFQVGHCTPLHTTPSANPRSCGCWATSSPPPCSSSRRRRPTC